MSGERKYHAITFNPAFEHLGFGTKKFNRGMTILGLVLAHGDDD
jgi:hypothetical protein